MTVLMKVLYKVQFRFKRIVIPQIWIILIKTKKIQKIIKIGNKNEQSLLSKWNNMRNKNYKFHSKLINLQIKKRLHMRLSVILIIIMFMKKNQKFIYYQVWLNVNIVNEDLKIKLLNVIFQLVLKSNHALNLHLLGLILKNQKIDVGN